jgi:hypothetical protein
VLDTLQLDNTGTFSITISNDSSAYSASADTIVITLSGYFTSPDQASNSIYASDTLIYRNHKTPVVSLYSTNFEECYIYPNPLPYVLYELETAQNSTVYYSINYEGLYSYVSSGSQFAMNFPDDIYPNPQLPYSLEQGFTMQFSNSDISLDFSSTFNFDSNVDTSSYVLLESSTALAIVPENSDLIIRIDSIDYGACIATYNNSINTITTPSIVLSLNSNNQVNLYGNSDYQFSPITYYDWFASASDYSYYWPLFIFEGPAVVFSTYLHNNLSNDQYDIDISVLINADTAVFHITDEQRLDTDTIDDYIFELDFSLNELGAIFFKGTVDTFPRNDSLKIQILGYSGLDGCFHTAPLIPYDESTQVPSSFNFSFNPSIWLGTDTISLSCSDIPHYLHSPVLPEQTSPDEYPNFIYQSGVTFWFTDYNDPLHSFAGWDSTFQVLTPGIYYSAVTDSAHNVFYEKQYVVLLNESGASCDDLNPCTLNDITQPDCTCVGTYTDTDEDGVCDALDDCDSSPAGAVCDDGDECTLNDVIQTDCTCSGLFSDGDGDGICDAQDPCNNSLAGGSCDDGDNCTVNDIIQADCSCVGTYSDNDGDGLCDASDPCDNFLSGNPCDDNNPCTMNDILQADCSCTGILADADGDGVCDAEDNCDNTLAGTVCDDGDACTVNDVIQADCACAGSFADTDGDGICDGQEVGGCTDSEACNYNASATDDNGTCSYVESFAIVGNTNVNAGMTEEYTYPGQPSGSFEWVATPGTITAGQGTPLVSVVWDDTPNGTVQVTETNETNCIGQPVVLEVNITPNAITAFGSSSLRLYPNPANDLMFVSGNIPSSTKLSLFNSIGQCVETGSFQTPIDVSRFAEGMYYLRLELDGTAIQKAFTIIHHP